MIWSCLQAISENLLTQGDNLVSVHFPLIHKYKYLIYVIKVMVQTWCYKMIHRPFLYKKLQECDLENSNTEGKQMGKAGSHDQ